MEHWKPIPSFEGLYEISEFGTIKSLARKETTKAGWSRIKNEKTLKPYKCKDDRLYVDLCVNYKKTRSSVHRLVLLAFVGPCPEGMEACHNDGNHRNNHYSNLRWDTHKNNLDDKYKHGTHICGENHKLSKLKEDDVRKIRDMATKKVSVTKIAETFNVSRRLIRKILTGLAWTHVS